MTLEDDVLPPCTVRVDVGGRHVGSGFFVAPGRVATCAHVLESYLRTSKAAAPEITVAAYGAAGELTAQLGPHSVDDDLAILVVDERAGQQCVLLDSLPINSRNAVHTFAYPAGKPDGLGRNLVADGRTGGQRAWAAFSGGQVQKGMSGGPVLNLRTGGVAAVLNRTRDQSQDLGGYAIPVMSLFALDKTLHDANAAFHKSNRWWYEALDDEQRAIWAAARPAGAGVREPGRQLVVTLDQEAHGSWRVSATTYPGGENVAAEDVDLNLVRTKVARLLRGWEARGRILATERAALAGEILHTALFPGAIGSTLRDLLEVRDQGPVLIALRFADTVDDSLRELPWEHLCLPAEGAADAQFFAKDPQFVFVRSREAVPSAGEGDALPAELHGVVVGVPQDDSGKAGGTPIDLIADRLVQSRLSAIRLGEPLRAPNPLTLEGHMRDADPRPQIVHYVGFGEFKGTEDQIALGAELYDGVQLYPVGILTDALSPRPPRLVVLQLLETAGGNLVPPDFSVLAPAVLEIGVEAVVAYQSPAQPSMAAKFNEALYAALDKGLSVELAVQTARAKLTYDRASICPALFVERPGAHPLVTPPAEATPLPAQSYLALSHG